jgi:hypothetical protein
MTDPFASGAWQFIFNWDNPSGRAFTVTAFLIFSLAVHAFSFYLFQIVYPPTGSLLPPPARLSLIRPDTEESRTLLRWVEAEDPGITTRTQRPPGVKPVVLPRLEHTPSYMTSEPVLKQPPPLTPDLRLPSAQPPGAVAIGRPHHPQNAGLIPTTIKFSEEIEKLGAPALPPLKFVASTAEAVEAASFRVAVNKEGEILYAFRLHSSGDPALDDQARNHLAVCRFAPRHSGSNEDLVWGTATIQWGNDVTLPPQRTSPTPSP